MKRTIEIDDILNERVESAIDQVKAELESYLEDNDCDSCPDLGDLDYSGAIHEIVDGCVPIYTKQIKDSWYLYGDDLTEAYENAGVGDNPMENNGMAAIYFYIHEQVVEWFDSEAEDIFENFKKAA